MTKRVLIVGHFGFGNVGDDAILCSMVAHLREYRPSLQITVATGTPETTASTLGVETILWSDARAVFETVAEADLVIIGGGGIFHDYMGLSLDGFLTDNHWGVSFFAGPAVMAMLCQKPVMLYAVGVGPLFSDHARQLTRIACDCAAAITVRDNASKRILESIGVDGDRIQVTADPAFGLPQTQEQTLASSDPTASHPRIAVALRPWRIGTDQSFWEREVAAGMDHFVRHHGGSLIFVPFELPNTGAEDDLAVARRVQSHMKESAEVSFVEELQSPQHAMAILAECDLVVGMRLHSLILGMLAQVPVVALSYDTKVDQVMELAGMQDFILDIRSVEGVELAARMQAAVVAQRVLLIVGLAAQSRLNSAIAMEVLDKAEPRPMLPLPVANLIARGLQAQLRDTYDLRREVRRLHQVVEFHHAAHSESSTEAHRLAVKIAELEAAAEAAEREKSGFLSRANDLTAALKEAKDQKDALEAENEKLRRARDRLGQLERDNALPCAEHVVAAKQSAVSISARELAVRLSEAERRRLRLIERLDQFAGRLASDLRLFRAQRAWKVMLAIRKGYTLYTRSGTLAFLRWITRLPFAGPGRLDECDLIFPELITYLPENLNESLTPGMPVPSVVNKLSDLIPVRKYAVIILAIFDFDFRFQRPQQLAAQFARDDHPVFWVSPARFLHRSAERSYEAVALRDNLWEIRLRGTSPDLYQGRSTQDETDSLVLALTDLYNDFQIAESCVLIQFPYWRQLGLALRDAFGAIVVYDCMDDWQNWTAEPRIGEFSLSEERKLVTECDVLVASSEEFRRRYKSRGIEPVLARNGADIAFFSDPPKNSLLSDCPKPIIGYYGAIANWFDIELLIRVASSRPGYSFVLVGQVHQIDVSGLAGLPNVHLLGEKHYRQIPAYLANFDVCLIPFKLTALTRGVDPVKLYEYLSQGKPVVATPLEELPTDHDLLYTAAEPAEFCRKIDLALNNRATPALVEQRLAFARANTWALRVRDIDRAIVARFPLVSILIVTHNCEEFVEPCMDSVVRNTSWPNYEVILVDNASTDRTKEMIRPYAGSDHRIRAIFQDQNTGFAEANNLAAGQSHGEYIVFLNPDTIVTPGWLGRMVRHCQLDPEVGAVAAVTNFSGNETKIQFRYSNVLEMQRFALELAATKANQSTEIEMAALYCVLVPRHVWLKVGELDPKFGAGMFEDDDFSLRIRRAGYRIVAAENCFIHHFGNGSFGKVAPQRVMQIFEENRRYFETKWKTSWKPHKLRPAVRPPAQEPRFGPVDFLRTWKDQAASVRETLDLVRLHPASTKVGIGFNIQGDGTSALAVDCANATPDTVIVMGTTILRTSYGSSSFLTGGVPPELYSVAGLQSVYLLNAFGESSPIAFEVIAPDVSTK